MYFAAVMSTEFGQNLPLRTLEGEISLQEALEEEDDMLQRFTYFKKSVYLLTYFLDHSAEIEAIVKHHLGLIGTGRCRLADIEEWIHGSFNICLPVYVKDWNQHAEKRVIIRFPLSYKVGEDTFPGNSEEKLRCEAATYIWIQKNCPDVPIPKLFGFAFGGNQCVS